MAIRNQTSIGEDGVAVDHDSKLMNGHEMLDLPFSSQNDSDAHSDARRRAPPMEVQFMEIDE